MGLQEKFLELILITSFIFKTAINCEIEVPAYIADGKQEFCFLEHLLTSWINWDIFRVWIICQAAKHPNLNVWWLMFVENVR